MGPLTPRSRRYSIDVSDHEAGFGFAVAEAASGIRVAMVDLGRGLRAYKRARADGSAEYVVCDEHLNALYPPAASLDELFERFDASRTSRPPPLGA